MKFSEIIRLLRTPLKITKIVWSIPGFATFEFAPDDVLSLEKANALIEDVLREQFVEQPVMWLDLRKEDPVASQKRLDQIAEALKRVAKDYTDRVPSSHQVIPSLLKQWATACVLAAKEIRNEMIEMERNNRTAFHRDEIVDPSWFLPKILSKFRKEAYPVVDSLIKTLPDDSQLGKSASKQWEEGRNQLSINEGRDVLVAEWTPEIA